MVLHRTPVSYLIESTGIVHGHYGKEINYPKLGK